MTAKRLVASCMFMLLVTAMGGWYVVAAFPLRDAGAAQVLQADPGPLERAANPITPENPIPRRVHHQPAEYPADAAAANAWVSVTMRLAVDHAGTVAEARVTGLSLRTDDMTLSFTGHATNASAPGVVATNFDRFLEGIGRATIRPRPGAAIQSVGVTARPIIEAVVNAAVTAVQQWRYEAPTNAPISLDTTFYFVPGAAVTDTPAAAVTPSKRADGALRVGGNIKVPVKVRDVRPVYPPEAQQARVQGVVIVEATIGVDGRVADAKILRSIPLLDQAALDAVRQWEFVPVLLNGVPTPVVMTMTVQFSLQ